MRVRLLKFCAAALATFAIGLSGCSDDVVCPEPTSPATVYVSAQLVERAYSTPATYIHVAAASDTVPSLLAVFVNGTRLDPAGVEDMARLATLERDTLLVRPGYPCHLDVTADDSYSTSNLTLPYAASTQAPGTVASGETLRIAWDAVTGADYYRISGTLTGTDANTDLFLEHVSNTDYAYVVASSLAQGVISGTVDAVAGPFPEEGSGGNVSGEAWGYFTASYADSGSLFSVQVTPARP